MSGTKGPDTGRDAANMSPTERHNFAVFGQFLRAIDEAARESDKPAQVIEDAKATLDRVLGNPDAQEGG